MRKLSLLLLACAVLSSCGIGNKTDGGWTYDLPEGGFGAPDTGESSDQGDLDSDLDIQDVGGDQVTPDGEMADTKVGGAVTGVGAFAQLSDLESSSELVGAVPFETNPPVASPPPIDDSDTSVDDLDGSLDLDLPQRGPRPAVPSLVGEQPALGSNRFGRINRSHHRSIVSPVESPAKPFEPDAAAVELSPIEPFPNVSPRQGTSPQTDDSPDDISGLSDPQPDAIDLSEPQSDEISKLSEPQPDTVSELSKPEPNAIDLSEPQSDEISDGSETESNDLS
ncbi:MAG: hypothetical protein AAGC54_09970 [Cyanobacteria bacterium P01_F01_bin.4]